MKRAYIYTTPHPTKIRLTMTNDYRYRLDNSRPRIKVTCPACGRQKKLVRYIDTQTGRFLANHVGKCDRIFKCGYHYTRPTFPGPSLAKRGIIVAALDIAASASTSTGRTYKNTVLHRHGLDERDREALSILHAVPIPQFIMG